MANELNALADRINASRMTSSPGSASGTILGYMAELVDVLRVDKEVPGSGDKTAELRRQIESLNDTINWQNGILQQIKAISEMSADKTMTQLPDHIRVIMTMTH